MTPFVTRATVAAGRAAYGAASSSLGLLVIGLVVLLLAEHAVLDVIDRDHLRRRALPFAITAGAMLVPLAVLGVLRILQAGRG
jgi:hypothetical protein